MPRKKGVSLQNKALVLGTAIAVLALAATDLAFFSAHARNIVRNWDMMHMGVAKDWAGICEAALAKGDKELLAKSAAMILVGPLEIDYAYLAGPDGRLITHTDPRYVSTPVEEWRKTLPRHGFLERRAPVRMPGGGMAWAAIGYPEPRRDKINSTIREQQRGMLPPVLLANVLLLALIVGVAVVVSRTIIRPVRALAAAVRQVRQGDFKAQVPVSGSDEVAVLEAEFNSMAARLGEVERLKSDFLGKVTHDLRSPLGAVMGYVQLLLMEIKGPLNDYQKDALNTMLRNTKYLSELINNILDMTKIEAGRMEYSRCDNDPGKAMDSVATLLRPMAEEYGVELKVEAPAGLPPLNADPQALRRVLINLVSNALKFTPKGGAVTLAAANAEEGLRVSVRDTGIGIPPAKLGSIFSKFTMVHEQKDLPRRALGTGLGLAICREIVEGHGGRIWVESEVGKGTAFSFAIPRPVGGKP